MSLFDAAKTTKAAPKAKAKKNDKEEVKLEGIDDLATLDVVLEALNAKREEIEMSIKEKAADFFVAAGEKIGKRPDNIRGIDGNSSASVELRKRTSRSVLSEEEQDMLTLNKIPFEHAVDVPECFVINPAYAQDKKLMDKVSSALEKVPGLPKDFIQFQAEQAREIVSDETLTLVFARKKAEDLLPVVGTIALKPTAGDTDLGNAMVHVKKLLGMK